MRLWHQSLIPYLPRQQLLGQHRECCALRGKGWKKKHSTVDYVFKHEFSKLFEYHSCVMSEMQFRGYHVGENWMVVFSFDTKSKPSIYRGSKIGFDNSLTAFNSISELARKVSTPKFVKSNTLQFSDLIYPEHNIDYLIDCIENLKRKNVTLNGITFEELELLLVINGFLKK